MTTELFGEVIYSYTRAQAIDDGVLIDVSETAREAGFKYPVAVTAGVWGLIEPQDKTAGQSEDGRLWDTLWMLLVAIKTGRSAEDLTRFKVIYKMSGRNQLTDLKAQCHGGDNGEPVITIMLPDED